MRAWRNGRLRLRRDRHDGCDWRLDGRISAKLARLLLLDDDHFISAVAEVLLHMTRLDRLLQCERLARHCSQSLVGLVVLVRHALSVQPSLGAFVSNDVASA